MKFIDIAKGIGILFVVWQHITYNVSPFLNGYNTIICMPLFFTISGMFTKLDQTKHRIERLSISYCFFMLTATLLYIIKAILKNNNIDWWFIISPLLGEENDYPNVACWFLLSLMQITLLYKAICTGINNKVHRIVFCCFISIIAYYLGNTGINIKYYFDTSLLCLMFFAIGYEFKDYLIKKATPNNGYLYLCISVILYSIQSIGINISQNEIPINYLLFLSIAITSTIGLLGLSKTIKRICIVNKMLSFFWKNSLIILCTHLIIITIIKITYVFTNNIYAINLIGTAIILLCEIPIIYFINTKAIILTGKIKKK